MCLKSRLFFRMIFFTILLHLGVGSFLHLSLTLHETSHVTGPMLSIQRTLSPQIYCFLIYLYVMKSWISSLPCSVMWTEHFLLFAAAEQDCKKIILERNKCKMLQLIIGFFSSKRICPNMSMYVSTHAHISLKRVKQRNKWLFRW